MHLTPSLIPSHLKPRSIVLSNLEKKSVHSHSVCSTTLDKPLVPILCERWGDCSAGLVLTETAYLIYAAPSHLPSWALLWQFQPSTDLSTALDGTYPLSPNMQGFKMPFNVSLVFHLFCFLGGSICKLHVCGGQVMQANGKREGSPGMRCVTFINVWL